MPFKYDADGHIVLQEVNGQKLPVFVNAEGKEAPFDGDSTVATISRLNGEAKGHRERAEKAEGTLKTFEGITDPAAAIKALNTVKNLDDKKLVDAGEVERVKSEAIKSVEEKYAPVVKKAGDLEAQLNGHLIGGAFSRSKFIAEKFAAEGPAGVEIAQALFQSRFKVEDGKVVAYDAQGGKIFSRTRHGELADAEEAIEIMVDAYPHKAHILKGTGANGGGAQGGGNGGNGKRTLTREQFSALDPVDQAKAARDPNVSITD
ncbi:DUF6651 domain-containing protein [Cupriavidus taiwanensis]|uniref:DUF6651 domain-containing protein n=1 Tax=Cupriavidus taiwanensis TaxID=164546 RepID=UPI000E103444|nr:DUF6651 domain-containing protein [Cupriavidus taiwanensis]SOY56845.1 conserved hypothetical protein [Cupriavidus taiwanensis]SOY90775.1 conserved hypothetical protein [Cupriavidus taiwanensis]SOZ63553.1 conserved hypothetical protein [Cupriavidus taiwanensis]SOZ82589.1 conserved hypothetical protein [Cupriavidus taiwanensis]SOZ84438.1 conserved hypothetical protein [Cupriavidus taiwanensis]